MLSLESRAIRKFLCLGLVLMFWLIAGSTGTSHGAASVKISLPDFKVTLNSKVIDNSMRKYPLIVYKDITYVPMTWYDSRFLGLEADWDNLTGLDIRKTGIVGTYYDDLNASKNNVSYSATVPEFAITVNNKPVINSKELYPLLNFRGITYFPLTWRFAVEEFGWAYDFSQGGGLIISSGNTAMDSAVINIPGGNLTISEDVIYYVGKDWKVYSAPLNDPAKAKFIYQPPPQTIENNGKVTNNFDYINAIRLTPRSGGVQLAYNTFNALASTHYVDLTPGSAGEDHPVVRYVENSGMIFRETNYFMLADSPDYENNLNYKTKNDKDFRQGLTDPSVSSDLSGGIVVSDNYIYSTAYVDEPSRRAYFVYKTNIADGKSTRVAGPIDFSNKFFIRDSSIYYLTLDGYITRADLDGKNPRSQLEKAVSAFIPVNDDIYYLDKGSKELYRLSDGKNFNTGGGIDSLVFTGGLERFTLESNTAVLPPGKGYIVCNFGYDNTKFRRLILDDSGKQIYQSGSSSDNVIIYKDKLYYINSTL